MTSTMENEYVSQIKVLQEHDPPSGIRMSPITESSAQEDGRINTKGADKAKHQDSENVNGTLRKDISTSSGFSLLSSVDILGIKTKFLEIVEELRILRVSDSDNEQRIKTLLDEKHGLEMKLEDAYSSIASKSDQHTRDIAEVKKQLEEKLCKLESEKQQNTVKADIGEKEVKALKEELRILLVTRYSLEKTVKEQEHRIKMQSSTSESHMSQMTDLEKRCKDVTADCYMFREQLTNLRDEVTAATEINTKLSRVNKHQKCIITSLSEGNDRKQTEIIDIKSKIDGKQYEEQSSMAERDAVIQRLKNEATSREKVTQNLKEQVESFKDEQQKTMLALSESHVLADRHLDNSLLSNREVGVLKNDLDKTKRELDDMKKQLQSRVDELGELNKERDTTVTALQAQVTEKSKRLEEIISEHTNLANAFKNLEELNSSWAKKNMDLNARVKTITEKLSTKETELRETKQQLVDSLIRPESVDIATSTEGFQVRLNKETNTDEGDKLVVTTSGDNLTEAIDDHKPVVSPGKTVIMKDNEKTIHANATIMNSSALASDSTTHQPVASGIDIAECDKGYVTTAESIITNSLTNEMKSTMEIKGTDQTSHVKVSQPSLISALYTNLDGQLESVCSTSVAKTTEATRVSNNTTKTPSFKVEAEMKASEIHNDQSLLAVSTSNPPDSIQQGMEPIKQDRVAPIINLSNTKAPQISRQNPSTEAQVSTFQSFGVSRIVSPHIRPWIDSSQTNADDLDIPTTTSEVTETVKNLKRCPHLSSINLSSSHMISVPVSHQDVRQRENRFSFTLPPYVSPATPFSTLNIGKTTGTGASLPSTVTSNFGQATGTGSLFYPTKEGDRAATESPPKLRDRLPPAALRYTTSWIGAAGDQQGMTKSSKLDSQERWPDFEEEFSAGSESQNSMVDISFTARQGAKRTAEEEPSLFSDDDEGDDDDPKAGVASQIERIQVFLKKDRLKRQKKN